MKGLVVDLFAGGGGASVGIEAALGRPVDIAINHSPTALAVHEANHPRTRHMTADIWEVHPRMATGGRRVDVLWASPDCTHFSVAKGGKPREGKIRSLAWVVVDWAREVRPRVIFLENVSEFRTWGPLGPDGKPDKARMGETFQQWLGALSILGYEVDFRVLDASQYGAPTRRRRLFMVARCDGEPIVWPEPTHGPGLLPLHTAAECIDWSIPCPSIFTRKKPLAEKTLRRIALGIQKFVIENPRPFIVKVNHGGDDDRSESSDRDDGGAAPRRSDRRERAPTLIQTGYGERKGQTPRALNLHEPLGTVVAGGAKHALVAAFLAKHYGGNTTPGSSLTAPMDTITTQDHHALVYAFLLSYQKSQADLGQRLSDPMRTLTTKDRFGLVTVAGGQYVLTDIGMRMLEPHELLRAQFGRFAADYDLSAAKTKTAKVRLIGNSVCPEAAEAVIRVNAPRRQMRRVA